MKKNISYLIISSVLFCYSNLFSQFQIPPYVDYIAPVSGLVPSGSDGFSMQIQTTSAVSNVPIIAEWNRSCYPNETIILTGENFSKYTDVNKGKDTQVVCYGKNNVLLLAKICRLDGNKLAISLPENLPNWSFYLLWVGNENGFSIPIAINKTDAWWVGPKTVHRGEKTAVHGRNLSFNNASIQSWVYIKPSLGGNGQWISPTSVNRYRVEFDIPNSLTNGNYDVWVHNGHGGNYGWSDPVKMIVENAPVFTANSIDITSYGAIANDGIDDFQAIQNAINAASTQNSNTVFLPAGTFEISTSLTPHDNLQIKGAGKELTIIKCATQYSANAYGMLLTNGLNNLKIEGLTFDTNNSMLGNLETALYLRSCTHLELNNVKIKAAGYSPLDFHSSERTFFKNCDFIGKSIFGGTANETYIDGCNFKLTNDTEAALFLWGSHSFSITNSTGSDFDSTIATGWGEGRWLAFADNWSINRNFYIANNQTIDLTVRPEHTNQNSGEQILWEGGSVEVRGIAMSATPNTVKINAPCSFTEAGRVLVITDGKGYGQIRYVTAVDIVNNIITIDKNWNVTPDATSRIDVGKFNDHFIIFNNYLDAKPRATASIEHIASAAIEPFGGTVNLIIDSNTSHQLRGFYSNWTLNNKLEYGNLQDVMQPNFFNVCYNNIIQEARYGMGCTKGWFSDVPNAVTPEENCFLGNIYSKNQFQNVLEDVIGLDSKSVIAPSVDMQVFENNTGTDVGVVYYDSNDNGPTPNQIFIKNITAS